MTSIWFRVSSIAKDGFVWTGRPDGLVLTNSNVATPTPTPEPATHHVVDLDNVTTVVSQGWQPQVAVTLTDSIGLHVAGATVSGTFSGHTGTVTCTTDAFGTCVLGDFAFKNKVKSTAFTVTDVVAASSTYLPTANSDPESDSDGTSIIVERP